MFFLIHLNFQVVHRDLKLVSRISVKEASDRSLEGGRVEAVGCSWEELKQRDGEASASKMEPQFSRLKNRCFWGIFFWGETLVNVGQILKMNACKTSTGTVIPDLGSARFREFDIEDVMRIFVCFSVS